MGIHERSPPEVHRQDKYRIGWKRGLISQGFHSVVKVKIRRFASESTHLRGFGLTSGRILTPEGLSPGDFGIEESLTGVLRCQDLVKIQAYCDHPYDAVRQSI